MKIPQLLCLQCAWTALQNVKIFVKWWEPELIESKPQETDGLSRAFNLLAEEFSWNLMSNTQIGAYRICKMRSLYHRAISHRFDGIRHQTMLIWKGEGRAKAVDLDSKHFFSGQMPYPSDIIFGQKRTNSPSLQLRVEVKCVSLKVATYQHLEKTSSALKCCLCINKLTSFVNWLLLECNRMQSRSKLYGADLQNWSHHVFHFH